MCWFGGCRGCPSTCLGSPFELVLADIRECDTLRVSWGWLYCSAKESPDQPWSEFVHVCRSEARPWIVELLIEEQESEVGTLPRRCLTGAVQHPYLGRTSCRACREGVADFSNQSENFPGYPQLWYGERGVDHSFCCLVGVIPVYSEGHPVIVPHIVNAPRPLASGAAEPA